MPKNFRLRSWIAEKTGLHKKYWRNYKMTWNEMRGVWGKERMEAWGGDEKGRLNQTDPLDFGAWIRLKWWPTDRQRTTLAWPIVKGTVRRSRWVLTCYMFERNEALLSWLIEEREAEADWGCEDFELDCCVVHVNSSAGTVNAAAVVVVAPTSRFVGGGRSLHRTSTCS